MQLYREKYADYGVTLAAECLASEDELSVPVSTLRRWLQRAGLWERRRSRKPHRRRRAGGSTVVSWCKWMDRTTTGLRGGVAGPC